MPTKATITVKEFKDNRYYLQWREGDSVASKYKGPLNLGEWTASGSSPETLALLIL